MADEVMPKFKQSLLSTYLTGKTLKIVIVDTADYTAASTHEFLTDVPSAARVATSAAIANLTFTDGTLDGDDPVFSAPTGDPIECAYLIMDTGVEATTRLLHRWEGLTLAPSGADVVAVLNALGMFTL